MSRTLTLTLKLGITFIVHFRNDFETKSSDRDHKPSATCIDPPTQNSYFINFWLLGLELGRDLLE